MHHTGTSIVSNITMSMSIHGGDHNDDFLMKKNNPLKFWERKDIVKINQGRLSHSIVTNMPSWSGYLFDDTKGTPIWKQKSAIDIVRKLDLHCNWVTKDPRFGVTLHEWIPLTLKPVCIILHRNKTNTVNSLVKYYNDENKWNQLFDRYYENTKNTCSQNNAPTLHIQHEDVVSDLYKVSYDIYKFLTQIGIDKVTQVTKKYINTLPLNVYDEAYVTLLNNKNENYLKGVLALAKSIRKIDNNKRDIICMVTPNVPEIWIENYLVPNKIIIKKVEPVQEFWWSECEYYSNKDKQERWGHMMTKLLLWTLPYKRIMYMDPDSILLKSLGTIDVKHNFMAQPGKNHPYFNAGVMILHPNNNTYKNLLRRGQSSHPNLYHNVIDCTEQALLNTIFQNFSTLPVMRPDDKEFSTKDVAIHWITKKCPKPWDVGYILNIEIDCNHDAYNTWLSFHNKTIIFTQESLPDAEYESEVIGRRLLKSDSEYEEEIEPIQHNIYIFLSCFLFGIILMLLCKGNIEHIMHAHKNHRDGFKVLDSNFPPCAETESDNVIEEDDKLNKET